MRIPCPYCGERDLGEFTYGGDASKVRPAVGSKGAKTWGDYVFVFENPKGPHVEYWQHTLGCRQWFKLKRDTSTNEILGVEQ